MTWSKKVQTKTVKREIDMYSHPSYKAVSVQ